MNARTLASPVTLLCLIAFSGCDTFDHFQKPPDFSSPGKVNAIPATAANEPVIRAANVPPLESATRGSLWRPGSKAFFRDPRARNVGDLLTVAVNLQEQAEFANQTGLTRTTANSMSITNLFGIGTLIGHIPPKVANTDPSINTAGSDSTQGQGDVKRSENIVVNVAATVVRVLPNNNLEIAGSQEIRLNNELREMQIRGIIRPEDIGSGNTISSDRIAEARIAYGGRGVSSDLQRPTWGQDIINRAAPF
ncbi:MAG: flagellar basal body L-ring protein FlgH [Rhodopila sp.]